MKTVYSERHNLHAPTQEFLNGEMTTYFEKPSRAQFVLDAVTSRKLGAVVAPEVLPLPAIHPPAYVDFLKNAHRLWAANGYKGNAMGCAFNVQAPGCPAPASIDGMMGYYTSDGSVPITPTSWEAIETSAHIALTAQKIMAQGEKTAFALCRPPGHHATAQLASGYCFLNNAALAAQAFLDGGAQRVAVLDVDYHHGNGTQDIFYDRSDVLFSSIHGDPTFEFPYFLGHAHEKGRGKGEGFNHNYPLPPATTWDTYSGVLKNALGVISAYAPEALVISLGVDTFERDPISKFKLRSEDYLRMGEAIANTGLPTLFVMEGGYAVEEIGVNAANVLEGFVSRYSRS